MAKSSNDGFDDAFVRKLAGLLDETGLTEIEYGRDDWHIRIARGQTPLATSAPQQAAPLISVPTRQPASESDTAGDGHPGGVASPMVGVVYLSPDPQSQPYVKVGDKVNEGDTLCLIEAMKVFNPIRASRAGTVSRILVNSGAPVEYGEILVVVE